MTAVRALLPVVLAATLAACAVPAARPQLAATSAASLGLDTAPAPVVADRWWTAFGDPQLDRIMADTLAGSPTLDAALARLRAAEAVVGVRDSDRSPRIDLAAQEQRVRLSDRYTIPPPFAGSSRWLGSVQANIGWSIDLWGRQAAAVAQARGTARATAFDAAAARLALTGSVAQTYVELVRTERLADIAAQFVRSRDESLRLVRSRLRSQLASRFDERTAEALLIEAQQAVVRATAQHEIMVHALAALAGRGADYGATIGHATVVLDVALPLPATLPGDLLGRRPDLLAGLARIDAAAAGRTVARTAFYPNIDLLGLAGFQALGLGALASGGALTYGAGPALSLPIFDAGRRQADYAGATAQVDIATADYNAAVAHAVRDAADAITRVRAADADAAAQARLVIALQDVVRLDQRRTASGLGSQLDILASGTRLLDARQAETDIAADGVIRRIELLVTTGGGFTPPAPVALSERRP